MNDKDSKLISEAYEKINEETDMWRKEKLAKQFADQYKIDPDNPMYPTILNAFAMGYNFGKKDAENEATGADI